MRIRGIRGFAFAALALTLLPTAVRAEDYTIGPEDVLQVSVWMHTDLDKTVTVGPDGNLTFPPAGDIKATGLTTKQLADRLGDKLSTYLRQTVTVTVTVSQYLSRSVYVVGAVGRPGRYGFQNLPSLVDLISQAGGALPGGDLSHVQIIRKEGEARRVINADVSSALRDGIGTDLPQLRPGDTVVINTTGGGAYTGAAGDAIAVLGEVIKPGLYPAGSGTDLWVVLAQAGSFTANANIRLVRVVSPSPGGAKVHTYDLKDAVEHDGARSVVVRPGEVVYITPKSTNIAWAAFTQTLAISRDILNIALAVDVIKRDSNP
jgi:polysaccharide export outer membrane protein